MPQDVCVVSDVINETLEMSTGWIPREDDAKTEWRTGYLVRCALRELHL